MSLMNNIATSQDRKVRLSAVTEHASRASIALGRRPGS